MIPNYQILVAKQEMREREYPCESKDRSYLETTPISQEITSPIPGKTVRIDEPSSRVFCGGTYTTPRVERRQIMLEENIGASISAQLVGAGGGVTQSDWVPDAVVQPEADGDIWVAI
jgi:hypothetical protein